MKHEEFKVGNLYKIETKFSDRDNKFFMLYKPYEAGKNEYYVWEIKYLDEKEQLCMFIELIDSGYNSKVLWQNKFIIVYSEGLSVV